MYLFTLKSNFKSVCLRIYLKANSTFKYKIYIANDNKILTY